MAVGFAAESEDVEANARQKLAAKSLDLIVANDISAPDAGFAVETNRVVLVDRHGSTALPLMSKAQVAEEIVARVAAMLAAEPPRENERHSDARDAGHPTT